VARIFASFNDTFVHVTDLRFVHFINPAVRLGGQKGNWVVLYYHDEGDGEKGIKEQEAEEVIVQPNWGEMFRNSKQDGMEKRLTMTLQTPVEGKPLSV